MSTVAQARRWNLLKRLVQLVVTLVVLDVLLVLTGPELGAVLEGLTPPRLNPVDTSTTPRRLQQNWPVEVSQKMHSISQGTHTLPVPLSWLMALEQPKRSLLAVPFLRAGRFMDDDYFLRFGFIKGERSEHNPLGLPVGVAVTPSQKLPGVSHLEDAVGFNCSACHTAQIDFEGNSYLIEGGPAATDIGLLVKALGAALGQTALAGKLPIFEGRFDRFARAVLGDAYSDRSRVALQADLDALVSTLAGLPDQVDVVEGFSRLDALNRIGNQVFALDNGRFENYVAINAPVNYPHIWTSSWFDWVQYDGSIMAPLIRNSGEALGVSASVNTTAPQAEGRFASSVDLRSLIWIENALAGPPPHPRQTFEGLLAPPWPDELPSIDRALADRGRALYTANCQGCHLPPLDSPAIWGDEYFSEIVYYRNGQRASSPDKVLRLKNIPLWQIGTDPAQANVLVERRVNTAGNGSGPRETQTAGMGLNTPVCAVAPEPYAKPDVGFEQRAPDPEARRYLYERLVEVPVRDGPNVLFALALGGVVQQANDAWFAQNFISDSMKTIYEEGRPNCLRAGAGYRARPLNGVWATAPFLHNGSVPTVWDLLSPPEERPDRVQLGSKEFDPVKLGVMQREDLAGRARARPDQRYVDGYFILDTSLAGNHNTGHEFSDRWIEGNAWYEQPEGVIGRQLSEEDRRALIEFLKTQ